MDSDLFKSNCHINKSGKLAKIRNLNLSLKGSIDMKKNWKLGFLGLFGFCGFYTFYQQENLKLIRERNFLLIIKKGGNNSEK